MTETPPDSSPPCPSINGAFTAYAIEVKGSSDCEWRQLATAKYSEKVPYPLANEGVLRQIGLLGYAQARALAWRLKSEVVADGILRTARDFVKVRVVPYEVCCDIKISRREDSVEIK